MIRKTLILGLLVVVALVLAAPAMLGLYLARYHDAYVRQLSVPGLLAVSASEFSRGWFRSHSRIEVVPGRALCSDPPCPAVTIDSVIHHGPIPLTAPSAPGGGLSLARGIIVSHADLAPLFPDADFDPPLPRLEAVTRIALDGAAETTLTLPAARLEVAAHGRGGRLNMERLRAGVEVPAAHDAVHGHLAWPAFNVVAEKGGQLGWRGLTFEADGAAGAPLFWRHYRFGLDSLQTADRQGHGLALQGLVWKANMLPAPDKRMTSEFDLRVSRLVTRGDEYGPAIVEGRLQGVDPGALQSLQRDLRRVYGQDLPPAVATLAALAVYRTHLPQLLAAGPDLRVKRLLLGTPDGDIAGHFRVAVPAGRPLPENFVDVLERLQADASLRVPVPLMRAAVALQLREAAPAGAAAPDQKAVDARIKRMLGEKLLLARPSENAYQIDAEIEDGQLTVNGKSRPRWRRLIESLRDNSMGLP